MLSMAALTTPLIMEVNAFPLSLIDYFAIFLLTIWLFIEFEFPSTPKRSEIKERLSLQILFILQPGAIFAASIQYFWHGPTLFSSEIVKVLGIGVAILGVYIRGQSMKKLGKKYTMVVSIRDDHEIIKDGIYKYIRHPGYLGQYLFLLGYVLLFQSVWGLIVYVLWGIGQLYRINIEEKVLENFFGNNYRDYQIQSKRLIPFIY